MVGEIIGIVGYGAYVPRLRIKVDEIAKTWGRDPDSVKKGLGVSEKSVPEIDEDTATISVEVARNIMKMAQIDPAKIGAVYVGSESHPYAVKPTSSIIAEAISATPFITSADLEFACKAGTAGIQMCMGLVKAGYIEYGISIGADTAQGKPGDALEYTAASGGAGVLVGKKDTIATINHTCSYTTDTPDFWRREGMNFPEHWGRFTGEPAYFKHIIFAAKKLMEIAGTSPEDYEYAVFHQPNGKFPMRVGKKLGFNQEKLIKGMVVNRIGNTYSGSSLIGLCAVLDIAKPGERILMTSYGSGAGSDSFDITVGDKIQKIRGASPSIEELLEKVEYVDYGTYAKLRKKLVRL